MSSVKTKTIKAKKTPKIAARKETQKAAGLDMGEKGKISPNPSFTKRGELNLPQPPRLAEAMAKLAFKKGGEMQVSVYNTEGQEVEKIKLPAEIFGLKINNDLVKQAYEAQMSQARIPYAHTKDRGEVRGGGKKPWRQKGTGRARHGSIRSPIWRGGGVTHGPRKEKIYAKDINKKMRRKALLMVLSGKARDNELIVLNDLKLEQPKTKLMAEVVKSLKLKVKSDLGKGALVAMAQKDENVIRATKNIPKFMTIGAQNLNVADLLKYRYLIMIKGVVEIIEKTFLKR